MLTPYRFASLTLALALSIAGCGGEDAPSAGHHDAGHDDHHDDDDEPEPCTAAYPSFREGLTAKAGELTVRLLSVDPDPVRQKQDNTWVLEVVDAEGEPVADASIVEPDTWMDVHNHGGRWEPEVEERSEPGQFELTKLDFKMPGPWRLRFGVKASDDAEVARTTFQICVE